MSIILTWTCTSLSSLDDVKIQVPNPEQVLHPEGEPIAPDPLEPEGKPDAKGSVANASAKEMPDPAEAALSDLAEYMRKAAELRAFVKNRPYLQKLLRDVRNSPALNDPYQTAHPAGNFPETAQYRNLDLL